MSKNKSNSRKSFEKGQGKNKLSKYTKKTAQSNRVYRGFFEQPQSMKMLSTELNIDRSSICWFCRDLRKSNKIEIAKKGACKITKRIVNYYTTNPDLFLKSNQLKIF